MNEPRERELKFGFVSRGDFLRALRAPQLGEQSRVDRIENHYFDTADRRLAEERVMLRLRTSPYVAVCLKVGSEPRPGYFDSLELETAVCPETAAKILADPEEVFRLVAPPAAALYKRFGHLPLRLVGSLDTERSTKTARGLSLEFDRVIFPDGSEAFELEIETDDPEGVERWLGGILDDLGVEVRRCRLTKLERLLASRGPEGPAD